MFCCKMDDVLKERCEQLKATHQADADCLKDEHEKNLKNLAQEFKDKVLFNCFRCFCSQLQFSINHNYIDYSFCLLYSHLMPFLHNLFDYIQFFA